MPDDAVKSRFPNIDDPSPAKETEPAPTAPAPKPQSDRVGEQTKKGWDEAQRQAGDGYGSPFGKEG